MTYINSTKFLLIKLEKDQCVTKTRRLENVIIFIQTILKIRIAKNKSKRVQGRKTNKDKRR